MENEHKKPPRKKKKLKKLELEEKAREKGRILGQIAAHKKKPLEESLKEHLGKWIDNINPLDLAATIGLTIIVKGTIDSSTELLEKVKTPLLALGLISPVFLPFLPLAIYKHMPAKIREIPDWQLWLLSFTIAYIIVKHGGQLLGLMKEGSGSLSTVISALLI